MRDEKQAALLRLQDSDLPDRTPFCPSDQQVAEYFDHRVPETESTQIERHLADCRHCRARVGIIQRLDAGVTDVRISEETLAAAKQTAGSGTPGRFRAGPAWATAAAVVAVLAVVLPGQLTGPGEQSISKAPLPVESRQLRSYATPGIVIQVLNPAPGSVVAAGSVLEWAGVANAVYYEVSVMSRLGDIVLSERVDEPAWLLDQMAPLESGMHYYFRVLALMPDGRIAQSPHVEFQVAWE